MTQRSKPPHRGLFLLILVSLSMFTFIISTLVTTRVLRRVTTVIVPDLTHKSFESARSVLRVQRLPIEISEYRFDRQVPINHIIAQDPSPGQTVKSGRKVRVVLSRGTSAVKVPPLAGMNLHKAANELAKSGLNVGKVTRYYTAEAEKDIVLDQSPQAGELQNRGSNVVLLVSQGPKPVWYLMPNLRGLTRDQGIAMLNFIQVELKEIKRVLDDSQPSGTIREQTPLAGLRVRAGDPAGLAASIQTADQQQGPRLVDFTYHVPDSKSEVRLKLIIRDNTGLHEIHNTMEKPNAAIRLRKTVQGENAKMYIYINNILQEQKDI